MCVCVSRRAHLSWGGKIKGVCVERSVSHPSNGLGSLQHSPVIACVWSTFVHNTLFCEAESPRSSIKGPFVFGYLFMDLLPSFLKMMSDTLHLKKCFYV